MRIILGIAICCLAASPALAEQTSFGPITYSQPEGWGQFEKCPTPCYSTHGSRMTVKTESGTNAQATANKYAGQLINSGESSVAGQPGYFALGKKGNKLVAVATAATSGNQIAVFLLETSQEHVESDVAAWGTLVDGASLESGSGNSGGGGDGGGGSGDYGYGNTDVQPRKHTVTIKNGAKNCTATIEFAGQQYSLGPGQSQTAEVAAGDHLFRYTNNDGSPAEGRFNVPQYDTFTGGCLGYSTQGPRGRRPRGQQAEPAPQPQPQPQPRYEQPAPQPQPQPQPRYEQPAPQPQPQPRYEEPAPQPRYEEPAPQPQPQAQASYSDDELVAGGVWFQVLVVLARNAVLLDGYQPTQAKLEEMAVIWATQAKQNPEFAEVLMKMPALVPQTAQEWREARENNDEAAMYAFMRNSYNLLHNLGPKQWPLTPCNEGDIIDCSILRERRIEAEKRQRQRQQQQANDAAYWATMFQIQAMQHQTSMNIINNI